MRKVMRIEDDARQGRRRRETVGMKEMNKRDGRTEILRGRGKEKQQRDGGEGRGRRREEC